MENVDDEQEYAARAEEPERAEFADDDGAGTITV
jgi:hypothetical protein